MSALDLLAKLTSTPGVPGREHRIRQLILDEIGAIFDEISVDPLGSIIAVKKPAPKRARQPKSRCALCWLRIWTKLVSSSRILTKRAFST